VLTREFADTPGVEWSKPAGGYFVTLTVPEGTATEIIRLAKEAGLALTPAGATHPYGEDPQDSIIRLAPTFPVLAEVRKAMEGVAVCVRLALAQK
jgi:DNA-binding transcriptional MocR family regulator